MKRSSLSFVVSLLMLGPFLSVAAERVPMPSPAGAVKKLRGNCLVFVTVVRKSGARMDRTRAFEAPTLDRCRAMAEQFETNFNPQVIREQKVRYAFAPMKKAG